MLNSLRTNWNALSLPQRGALLAVLVAVFGGILLVSVTAGRPSYAVLFSNLGPEDAGAMTSRLKDQKIDYRLTNEGHTIEVPADKVYDLRLSLANEGLLPRGGNVGLELFDKTTFGTTDFVQHLNYQRGQQGELARTIQKIDGVLEARVHLAIPEKALFSQKEEPVKASVLLKLRPNYRLDSRQIGGITRLVSAAIERLTPENVSIGDAQGNLLSVAEDSADLTGGQLDLQSRYERRLSEELQQLANRVLGPGKSAIRVSAEMDWDQTQTTMETYKPSGNRGENLPTEERTSTEGYSKAGSGGGAPGTLNNATAVANPLKPGDFDRADTTRKYVVNKNTERRTTAPGKIKRLSLAVFVDSKIDSSQQLALRNTLAASAGLDLAPVSAGGRGDKIEVMLFPFDTSVQDEAKKEEQLAAKEASQSNLMRNGTALVTILLVAGCTLLLTRKSSRKPRSPRLDATIGASEPPPALSPGGSGHAIGSIDPRDAGTSLPLATEDPRGSTAIDRVRQIAADQPEEVAAMLQQWLRGPQKSNR